MAVGENWRWVEEQMMVVGMGCLSALQPCSLAWTDPCRWVGTWVLKVASPLTFSVPCPVTWAGITGLFRAQSISTTV